MDPATIEKCAEIVEELLHTPTLLLLGGEMTAQEIRTVKAVLKNRARVIRAIPVSD